MDDGQVVPLGVIQLGFNLPPHPLRRHVALMCTYTQSMLNKHSKCIYLLPFTSEACYIDAIKGCNKVSPLFSVLGLFQ